MIFGRVRGQAISTLKYPDIKGYRLLVVEPLNKKLEPAGPLQVAVDVVEANQDDLCVMVRSREAALRREGGKLMGSGGPDADGAMAAAVGEALTRAGGGHVSNPNPHKPRDRHVAQLQQLGLSPLEAQLLREVV